MAKEIGGYLGLDEFVRNEYYPNLIKLNLGRTALLYLLEGLHCKRLFLPFFLCDSVTECCVKAGYAIKYYSIDQELTPQLDELPGEDEYVYLVNYYGQLTDEKILAYQNLYKNIIVDHTHSFFQRPLPGIPTLYSCRKFFGLPDGAYISAEGLSLPDLPIDVSHERMEHILGRYEVDAGTYYQTMLKNAAAFHEETPKRMSRLTENLLNAIDYEKARISRNTNYAYLAEQLGADNPLHFMQPDGAFVYPFYHKDAQVIRKSLASQKIFIPCYWANLIAEMPENSVEYDYAAHILPLPCDQRYTPEDLSVMVDALKQYL